MGLYERHGATGTAETTEVYQTRVLVADDDPDMRAMMSRTLRRAGYDVIEVADGEQLLEVLGDGVLRHAPPDLVVSDIRMPGFSGIEVLAGLRRADWAMPVILITAFGDRQTHEDSRRLGAVTLLDKPFEMTTLLETVRAVLPAKF